MNQYNRIQAAARFMLEAPVGAVFQEETIHYGWQDCNEIEAFTMFINHPERVRLRPTPKKVLRPAEDIINESGAKGLITIRVYPKESQIIAYAATWGIPYLVENEGKSQAELPGLPDWFFTEVEG